MWDQLYPLLEEEVFNDNFSINKVFRIGNKSRVGREPAVHANFSNKCIAIAVEKTLVLFQNEKFLEFKVLELDENINCLIVSRNSEFILCGLSDGRIIGVYNTGVSVFTVSINESDVDHSDGRTFVGVAEHNADYYFCCRNGKIYKVHNIENEELNRTLASLLESDETINFNETLTNNVLVDLVIERRSPVPITAFSLTMSNGQPLFVCGGGKSVFVKAAAIDHEIFIPNGGNGIKRLQSSDIVTLILTQNGRLYELCSFTFLFRPLSKSDIIKDFVLTETADNRLELLTLVEATPSKELRLQIHGYPNMNCKLSLVIGENVWILDQPFSSANIYCLSGLRSSNSPFIDQINMCMVSESQPEKRLKTLLAKGLLQQAEEFALKFKLSLQPVYEEKTKKILSEIAAIGWNDKETVQKRFNELLMVAKLIENTEFLIQLRNVAMPDRTIMKQFLEFLVEDVKLNNYPDVLSEVNEQLQRLETLRLVDVNECDLHWQKFVQHPNLINYCFKFFESDMSMACLILKRHAANIISHLKESNVIKTLDTIPSQMEPFNIIQWMRHYFPIVSQVYPQQTPQIIAWTIEKTKSYQCLKLWPDIGLEFVKNMLVVFNNVHYLFPDARRHHKACIERVQQVAYVLEELVVLKTTYNLVIPFDDYFSYSIEDCAIGLLQRINIKNLASLVNDFLFPLFSEKGKSLMPTLARYIEILVNSRKSCCAWQERSIACLQLIPNEEEKLKCAVKIAKVAPVPWSKVLDPLLELSSSSSHPLALQIDGDYKMQEIGLLRIKYDWRPGMTEITDPTKFVQRILRYNKEEALDDVNVFIKFYPKAKGIAQWYAVHESARLGNIDKSIRYMQSFTDDEASQCYYRICRITINLVEDNMGNLVAYDGLMELLKFVMDKNIDEMYKGRIRDLISLQTLNRSEFNMNFTLQMLSDQKKIDGAVEMAIAKLLEVLKSLNSNFVSKIWKGVTMFSKSLKTDRFEIVLKLVRRVNDLHFTVAIAKLFLNDDAINSIHYLDLAILLICQQYKVAVESICQSDSTSYAYPLALLCLQKVKDTRYGSIDVCQLMHFVKIGADAFPMEQLDDYLNAASSADDEVIEKALQKLVDKNIKVSGGRRDSMSIFEEVNPRLKGRQIIEHKSEMVVKSLSILLKIIVCDIKPQTSFYEHFKHVFAVSKTEPSDRTEFCTSLEQLIKSKFYTSVFSIMHCVRIQQKSAEKKVLGDSYYRILLRKILKSALHQKEPQFDILVPILHSDMDPVETLEWLKDELKSGLAKINCLLLSEKFGDLKGDTMRSDTEKNTRLKYQYYIQLRQIDPTLKDDFKFDTVDELFQGLNQKIIDIKLLEKISSDFDWNYQKILCTQIITILSIQELVYETESDSVGKEHLVVKVSVEKIQALCQPYIEQIIDTKALAERLYMFVDSINPYFYELYLCVVQILTDIRELRKDMVKWANILEFLKFKMVGKRAKRIGQLETDWWLKTHGESVMPKISKYRLPFACFNELPFQEFLGEQVTVQDCVQWFPLIKLLVNDLPEEIILEQNKLCMTAVKYALSEGRPADATRGTWNLKPINNAFLQSILNMVSHMNDIHRILLVLYLVHNNAAEGADQIEAAEECYKFALKHEQEFASNQRSKDVVSKIKKKYPLLKVQHLLHLYGLYDDKLSKHVKNPFELINVLYTYASDRKLDTKCDLNQVAKEIAELNQLDFDMVQMTLLNNWLSFASGEESNNLDQTYYDDLNETITPINGDFELNEHIVERAYCILKSWDSHRSLEFIMNHFNASSDSCSVNTGRQLQLLDCLMKLLTEDTVSDYLDFVDQTHYNYTALKCVHYLKQFGFKLSPDKFEAYDKLKILKQIWASNANDPNALKVISYICVGYNIYEPKIWNNVLKQMVNLHMADDLSAIIETISFKESLMLLDGMVVAYDYLIRLPFKCITKTRSEEQDEAMCKALFMLQSCQVKHKIDIFDLASTCVSLGQNHIAGVLIALAENGDKDKIFQLLEPHRKEALKADIEGLEEFGIYPFITKQAIKELRI